MGHISAHYNSTQIETAIHEAHEKFSPFIK